MVHHKLINPESIVVVGGSDNLQSPGGRVLKNLTDHNFRGEIFVVNPKQERVQQRTSFRDVRELPQVDLAIIAIPARFIFEAVKVLTEEKGTKGFIIFSAGFSEKDEEGRKLEKQVTELIELAGGSLLGPNNIGLINSHYAGVFTLPIPKLDPKGVDFISGSGATAVFMIEAAQSTGLTFSSVYTVGNSAQIGVEEVLEYFDVNYEEGKSSKIKLLYLESIKKPDKFLKHGRSLIQKGCKIAAIKAGSSEEGNRAASSHTGALAGSDVFVDTLFKEAGIIRCYGRNELITLAGILMQKESKGKNMAIITHAGGPAVMLTDVLAKNGLKIPQLHGEAGKKLLETLYDGSSVANPIDFLATGTAEQLSGIIDCCENEFTEIDAMVVIFGSPGLTSVYDVYEVLDEEIRSCKKPVYAVLPSVVNVKDEMDHFLAKGNIIFTDEVLFGSALAKVYQSKEQSVKNTFLPAIDAEPIRNIIDDAENGYLSPENAMELLRLAGIRVVESIETDNRKDLLKLAGSLTYPVVQKVVGPLHKSDVGGVVVNINSEAELLRTFDQLMKIEEATGVLIQPMISGMELFIGAKKETNFPHIVLCGMGGIFVEVLKDIKTGMVPVSRERAVKMIQNLKAYPMLKGIRGKQGIELNRYAENIQKVSRLLEIAPEITELDINPLLAEKDKLIAVDVRIRIEK